MTTFCQYPSDNHSKDKFRVFHGSVTPLHLCGYHATQYNLNDTLRKIEETKK